MYGQDGPSGFASQPRPSPRAMRTGTTGRTHRPRPTLLQPAGDVISFPVQPVGSVTIAQPGV